MVNQKQGIFSIVYKSKAIYLGIRITCNLPKLSSISSAPLVGQGILAIRGYVSVVEQVQFAVGEVIGFIAHCYPYKFRHWPGVEVDVSERLPVLR